jgi:hypothetical protein
MEFGWREVDAKPTECFTTFLRQLMEAYPGGPCGAAMAPYVDHCNFVGKLETASHDLAAALTQAGEGFDPAALEVAPMNASSNPAIRRACVTPLDVLETFMQADAGFCARFGYESVPQELVGAPAPSPWPKLRSKRWRPDGTALPLSRTRFAYHLDDGSKIGGDPDHQRLQWGLIKSIQGIENPGRTAVVSEVDPFAAHLLASKPGAEVTFVPADARVRPQRLIAHLRVQPTVTDFRSFHETDAHEDFDTIMLVDSAELSGALEGELLLTVKRLKPGGQLLLVAPVLHADVAVSTTFDADAVGRRGCMVVYRSLADWRTVLANCGFEAVEILDSFHHIPPPSLSHQVETLAEGLRADPAHLLGTVVLSARRRASVESTEAMRDLWVRRKLIDLGCAYDSLPAVIEARLLMLESQVRTERLWRVQAEQGVADREAQMLAERKEAEAERVELKYAIDRARRVQAESKSIKAELEELRGLLNQLGCDPKALAAGLEVAANDAAAKGSFLRLPEIFHTARKSSGRRS